MVSSFLGMPKKNLRIDKLFDTCVVSDTYFDQVGEDSSEGFILTIDSHSTSLFSFTVFFCGYNFDLCI